MTRPSFARPETPNTCRRQPARLLNGGHPGQLTSICRPHDVNPRLHLTRLFVNLPTTASAELPAWLPEQWKVNHQLQRRRSKGISAQVYGTRLY
jgi:hypothetical protein